MRKFLLGVIITLVVTLICVLVLVQVCNIGYVNTGKNIEETTELSTETVSELVNYSNVDKFMMALGDLTDSGNFMYVCDIRENYSFDSSFNNFITDAYDILSNDNSIGGSIFKLKKSPLTEGVRDKLISLLLSNSSDLKYSNKYTVNDITIYEFYNFNDRLGTTYVLSYYNGVLILYNNTFRESDTDLSSVIDSVTSALNSDI